MSIQSFDELIKRIQNCNEKKIVAVVSADDEHTLEAVIRAKKSGVVEPILIGSKKKIVEILESFLENADLISVIDENDPKKAAQIAVKLVHENKADFIMKGKIQTADLMKAIVNKEDGLRANRVMSLMVLHEMKSYHKLLAVTDGGMNLNPNLEEKKQIVENAVDSLRSMGYENPKVAVLCAVENVNPKMSETIDANELKKMSEANEIQNCTIEGPISYDLAMSKESAKLKGYKSEVSEDADILVVPNMTAGNILGKSLVYSAGAKMAGIILGAKVPIVLTSRGASSEEKFLSLVISASAVNKNGGTKI
ncbi:bifunctional enoyl-CoA hydratase/phosphate acetyltransferase [Alkalibaculum sp. M08DMB]|uniref:Bifunctional enoyl-CoA hydratase/phosphate acetyltransferase n=1 Tax=Alkalibaculum sporogenes TaxID=2655001 RepID=A0A6A7K8H0_9FIRM|nr:bifunctional enoyl-CoA hydratase/phosphate acetyltransferase [Alkalibaculum sporogenes]MPW25686.1 bifunctional enoyl-CoA hydratase/phosphate acetyltransferase [Alkalibaculum sporogenes]